MGGCFIWVCDIWVNKWVLYGWVLYSWVLYGCMSVEKLVTCQKVNVFANNEMRWFFKWVLKSGYLKISRKV